MGFTKLTLRHCARALGVVLLMAASAAAQDDSRRTVSAVAGYMTTNGINDVFRPRRVDFSDSGFAGVMLGFEKPLADPRWHVGVEVQANQHFGENDHQEFVVPLTIRYSPDRPWVPAIDSFAFGLGLSYSTSTPEVEKTRRGDSQRLLVYFSLETAFKLGDSGDSLFLRLHHRSDAYGLLATDSGSNAFAIGLRRAF